MNEADTRAKLIDPALYARGWKEDNIKREETAGAGVKTNLLFFIKGKLTEKIWYYDLSDIKVGKKTPLSMDRFDDFFRLLPTRGDSDRSWTVTCQEIEARNYDLKAVNPNAKAEEDLRKPEELLDLIEAKGKEVAEALAKLRSK